MKVKAIARGFDGNVVREIGDVFEFEGKLGKWMEKVDGQEEEPKKKEPAPKEKGKH